MGAPESRPARTLMVQGCTSDADKTTLVAALCRILQRRGVRVAPFKLQNMALNSAVTADGGEIDRTQDHEATILHQLRYGEKPIGHAIQESRP